MSTNLLHVTGAFYMPLGILLLTTRLLTALRSRSAVLPAYPRELARRHAKQIDVRFGLALATVGAVLIIAPGTAISVPLRLWPLPVHVSFGVALTYALMRSAALRPVYQQRAIVRPALFETRRSRALREAAQREGTMLLARETAGAPRDCGVIYLRSQWERQWWSDKFGVSSSTLQAAVTEVGPMKRDVERHLRGTPGGYRRSRQR